MSGALKLVDLRCPACDRPLLKDCEAVVHRKRVPKVDVCPSCKTTVVQVSEPNDLAALDGAALKCFWDRAVVDGIWTPWAEVVCRPCHGQTFLKQHVSDEEHARLCAPTAEGAVEDGNGVTKCDRCQRRCVVSEKVALEHEVVLALKAAGIEKASMTQTGGMCSAVRVPLSDERYVLVTESEDKNEGYIAGVYDDTVDCDEGKALLPGDVWTVLTRDQVIEAVKQAVHGVRA